MAEFVTELHTSLAAVDRAEWESTDSAAGLYTSYDWLSAEEGNPAFTHYYLVIRRAGQLVAAVACYLPRIEWHPRYDLREVLLEPSLPRARDLLVAGSPSGYLSDIRIAPRQNGEAAERARCELTEQLRKLAAEQERLPIFFYRRSDPTVTGDAALVAAEAVLRLPGSEFSDWYGAHNSSRRAKIRRERQAFADAGWRIEETELATILDECVPLASSQQSRFGRPARPTALRALFAKQAAALSDTAVFAARRDGLLGAFSLAVRYRQTLWMRMFGVDDQLAEPADQLYFNTGFYAPIEHAYRHGCTELQLGIGALQAKVHRGAKLTPLYLVPIGWQLPETAVTAAEQRVRAAIVDQLGEAAAADLVAEAGLAGRHDTLGARQPASSSDLPYM